MGLRCDRHIACRGRCQPWLARFPHAIRSASTPPTMSDAASQRTRGTRSRSTNTEISSANRIEDPRSAEIIATGAWVIAHSAIAYEAVVPTPPAMPSGQCWRA
ncbi:hypothetical protein G6F61_014479 [Rhizopus arrhizus]|nr:hypothetical protein G6F61_014479 [Rhizopus arrhizus]